MNLTFGHGPDQDRPADLATPLPAFSGKERDSLRERLSAYREEQELDERRTTQELENDLEQERHAIRDRGYDHGL